MELEIWAGDEDVNLVWLTVVFWAGQQSQEAHAFDALVDALRASAAELVW